MLTNQGQTGSPKCVQTLKHTEILENALLLNIQNKTFLIHCYSLSFPLTCVLIQLLIRIYQSSHAISRNRLPEQSCTKCSSANANMIVWAATKCAEQVTEKPKETPRALWKDLIHIYSIMAFLLHLYYTVRRSRLD